MVGFLKGTIPTVHLTLKSGNTVNILNYIPMSILSILSKILNLYFTISSISISLFPVFYMNRINITLHLYIPNLMGKTILPICKKG